MEPLSCSCKIKVYEPLEEYQDVCPSVLVVLEGVHFHPIPLPAKTPPAIKAEILRLLPRFQEDLPDLTPRRFLRNPIVKSYLSVKFPNILNPTMSDLHTSLANRSHLKAFIDQVRKGLFPSGTGWKDQYIWCFIDLDSTDLPSHPEDELQKTLGSSRLRFIVCMGREGSERLLTSQYVQSDIGFKRVVGFYEFELAGWERDAHTTVAHQRIFEAIEEIVFEDTGENLQWRHIHGKDVKDYNGKILHWGADQHGGQAKETGSAVSGSHGLTPARASFGIPHTLRASASKCKVKALVKELMCSLIYWVRDKEHSQFAFEAMCWAKSFIPEDVWRAGERTSNLIESVHADVFEQSGIRASYKTGHPTENTIKNLKRKFIAYRKSLEADDKKIWDANSKIQETYNKLSDTKAKVQAAALHLFNGPSARPIHQARLSALHRAENILGWQKILYREEVDAAKLLVTGITGSGQVA
ncbi:hypothetical protein B0H10DRAFT_1948621 [Mycena sp. CBHHK59/15]|nr:hypothetical protein B0H10DRAFT_1948621 [Mycena sp. CBHHK59/15]